MRFALFRFAQLATGKISESLPGGSPITVLSAEMGKNPSFFRVIPV